MNLSVLYRGALVSCNYGCGYCPFSKRAESAAKLRQDQVALSRFAEWIITQSAHRWRILFTPWGEALVRNWYRDAIAKLSHFDQIESVAVQTNLSSGLRWLSRCRAERVSLWATYHPTQTSSDVFLRKVRAVLDAGVRICVGAVGVPEFLDELTQFHRQLPSGVYLWVNAQRPLRRPYTPDEIHRFQAIDPQFSLTLRRQSSFGKPCPTGQTSFTVDVHGDMRRCHFVDQVIGNCYKPDWEASLIPRACPNRFCDCFLGTSQLLAPSLISFFGTSLLERVRTGE